MFLAKFPSFISGKIFSKRFTSAFASKSPERDFFIDFCSLFSTDSISRINSSVSIISISLKGLILPSTCVIFSSSKQRTTWIMASTLRMCDKN